ncbi:DNA glycosylase superfamily protein [Rhynchospora pubera]|uniref:DNA glycosylase superfamily protein n=1 Tax=Rhynchospora pubera TaxID=906938 RepID=A0AAV8D3J5_9POAL|nr:DNA glycosylase superfamily protein [Rhynchospora pubera]
MADMDTEARPVLVPGGNKTRPVKPVPSKPISKPSNQQMMKSKDPIDPITKNPSSPISNPRSIPKKKEVSRHRNLSLDGSCSSEASIDSFCSRPSSGSTSKSRRAYSVTQPKKEVGKKADIGKEEKEMVSAASQEFVEVKRRCSWVTANAEPCYVAFHDEEWGAPLHDDRKLFEILVLSSALAELSWPVILTKRHIFRYSSQVREKKDKFQLLLKPYNHVMFICREVFMDFDPVSVSKLNEKKLVAPGSPARSLLSESKLRSVIENSKQILKIIEEFGSFNRYIWGFVNNKPIVSRFRYPRQVPIKTSKAETISKDMIRRGLRCVGPTVVYTFMQVAGLTNDHLVSCFCFDKCVNMASTCSDTNKEEKSAEQGKRIIVEELMRGVDVISV